MTSFPEEFFIPMISATHPLLFGIFIAETSTRVQEIVKAIRQGKPAITSIITYLGEPARIFPDLKTIRLKEMIREAGF